MDKQNMNIQSFGRMELDGMALLKKSWAEVGQNIPLFAALFGVFGVVLWVSSMIPVGAFFVGGPLTCGLMVCALKLRRNEDFGFGDFFWSFQNFNRYLHSLILSVVVSAGTTLGLLFMLIPGIWFMVAAVFSTALFILYKQDGIGAIQKSIDLVRGRWWNIAGILGIIGVLNVIGVLCFFIGILVTTPLSAVILLNAAEALLDEEVKTSSQPVTSSSVETPT